MNVVVSVGTSMLPAVSVALVVMVYSLSEIQLTDVESKDPWVVPVHGSQYPVSCHPLPFQKN